MGPRIFAVSLRKVHQEADSSTLTLGHMRVMRTHAGRGAQKFRFRGSPGNWSKRRCQNRAPYWRRESPGLPETADQCARLSGSWREGGEFEPQICDRSLMNLVLVKRAPGNKIECRACQTKHERQ